MLQIVALALITGIIVIYLQGVNKEIALLAGAAGGILIVFLAFGYLKDIFSVISDVVALSGIDGELYKLIFKIVAVAYLVEFAAGIIEDFGLRGLASKLVFGGKVIILGMALPIVAALLNIIVNLVS
ncbi:MAG: stage III sporulation protein AD [Firmicutes bacterium]|nr:stage III sporulation protein AD [Bacillota bacterium]